MKFTKHPIYIALVFFIAMPMVGVLLTNDILVVNLMGIICAATQLPWFIVTVLRIK